MSNVIQNPTEADAMAGPRGTQAPDWTGTRLGDFQLLRRLGQGGMGQVYLAEQISLKRKVAVKILRGDLAANESALQRFRREAEAVARATHANIVQIYAINSENGLHYMALEYVEGRNLRDYLEKKGPPEVLVAIGILRQVASALQRASELGVIHRDIKPENILVTRKGEVKVADFGLSRMLDEQQPLNLTQSGVTMGTPLYMSPEQVEGRTLDPRTDIYSLGVTAYHLLTGQPPFRGQTPFEVALQHVQKEPVPIAEVRPDLPPELCAIVQRMMAKKPEERYQTAQEIVRDLSQLRDQLVGISNTQLSSALVGAVTPRPGMMSPSGDAYPTLQLTPVRARRLSPWVAALAVFFMLGVGSALGWWWNQHRRETPEPVLRQETEDPEKKEEEALLHQFAKFKDTNTSQSDQVQRGLPACIDLAWFYLKRDQRKMPPDFSGLDQYFAQLRQLDKDKFPSYFYLGELGEAVVLAMKDDAKSSVQKFESLLPKFNPAFKKKPKPGDPPPAPEWVKAPKFWHSLAINKDFRQMLSLAIERDQANLEQPLSTHLEFFRTIPHQLDTKKGP